jgi:hypothetical protein
MAMFSKVELVLKRQKAMRKHVWFKVLNQSERAIFNLTIQCVEHIKSLKLAKIMTAIVEKLTYSMTGKVESLSENIGRPLAQRLSSLAFSWGNHEALEWAEDILFIRYLTIVKMNTPEIFGGSGDG